MNTLRELKVKNQTRNLWNDDLQSDGRFNSMLKDFQIIDFNWRFIYVNDDDARQKELGNKKFLGHTMMEKYPGIEYSELFTVLEQCMFERAPKDFENEVIYPDRSRRWFQLSIRPVKEGISIMSSDITVHKEVEEKLRKTSDLYAFISQVNQKIVHVKNEASLFRNACQLALEFGKFKLAWIGLFDSEQEKIILIDQSGILTEDIALFTESDFQSIPQDYVLNTNSHYICNDIEADAELKNWKPFALKHNIQSCMVLPIKKSGGIVGTLNLYASQANFSNKEEIALLVEVAGDISFALDLFEKDKQHSITEKLVFENEKRFRAMIENSTDMITLSTQEGILVYGSPSITKMFGYSVEEMAHQVAFDFIHPEDIPNFVEKRNIIIQTPGKSFYHQHRIRHKNGNWIWCEGTVTNMLHLPAIHALVSNFRNISERKNGEEIMIHKNEELEKINHELDRFVYSASHDLRSPLCSILGLTGFIEKETKEANTLQYANMIRTTVNRLDGFINNILNYSKNNRIELQAERIPLKAEITEIVDSVRHMKNAVGINFVIIVDEQQPFYSDKHRFNVVMENLISNAIKFHDPKKLVRYIKISAKSDESSLHLQIEDNGIGIAPEYQSKIFDMFFRLSGKVTGSGIGLYIVKETMEKLQGSIQVCSAEGVGTTFSIDLKNVQPES